MPDSETQLNVSKCKRHDMCKRQQSITAIPRTLVFRIASPKLYSLEVNVLNNVDRYYSRKSVLVTKNWGNSSCTFPLLERLMHVNIGRLLRSLIIKEPDEMLFNQIFFSHALSKNLFL